MFNFLLLSIGGCLSAPTAQTESPDVQMPEPSSSVAASLDVTNPTESLATTSPEESIPESTVETTVETTVTPTESPESIPENSTFILLMLVRLMRHWSNAMAIIC